MRLVLTTLNTGSREGVVRGEYLLSLERMVITKPIRLTGLVRFLLSPAMKMHLD